MIEVGIVDDHQLVLNSIAIMLEKTGQFKVTLQGVNGLDAQDKLTKLKEHPDMMLIDVNMPVMDGLQTAAWIRDTHPNIKMVALTMNADDKTVLGMLKAGCCAFLLKDISPEELQKALLEVHTKGYYNSDIININFRRLLTAEKEEDMHLSEKELEFLQQVCSDLTYKEIADRMNITVRTAESHRNNLFQKFNVQSRTGLAMEAIRRGLVKIT